MTSETHEILIVGAGLAGLTAAAYLSKAGRDVLLIERTDSAGGLLNSFEKDGFFFDFGARSIENSGAVRPLLNELKISLELLQSPVTVGIENEIIHFTSEESLEDYKALLKKLYSVNVYEIDAIFTLIKEIVEDMTILSEIDNPIITGMKNIKYVFQRLLPYVLSKFLGTVRRLNKRNTPIEITLKKYTSNQSLIDIIAQHFFRDTPTSFALGYFHTYLDYFYPKGGTGKLTESIREKAVEFGTKIQYSTEICKIIPSEKNMIDSNGNSFAYENLIWCADLKYLYKNLNFQDLKQKTIQKIENQKDLFLKNRGGDSVFTIFLGIDEPLESFQSISNGHFFYTPSRKGLGTSIWTRLQELIANFEDTPKQDVLQWVDDYCKYNTYEISIPGLRDSTLVPKGKTGLIVSLLFEYDLFDKAQQIGWYEEIKTEIKNRMIDTLSNSIYPKIKEKILFHIVTTPLSISNRVMSSEGAITGWSLKQPVPVVQNLLKIFGAVKTPIPNILQAGQWVYSPSGIPIAILTGVLAAKKLIKSTK